jgi:hypothetical protein
VQDKDLSVVIKLGVLKNVEEGINFQESVFLLLFDYAHRARTARAARFDSGD